MKARTQNLVLAALFVALGLLIPILFHAVGLGAVFLPMFLPMALAAFLIQWKYAIAVGAITPIISSLMTGMPPLSPPIAQIMVFEGVALVSVTAWGFRHWRIGTLFPLAAGLLASHAVLFVCVMILAPIIGLPPQLTSAAIMIKGLPGVAMILIIIPFLINRLENVPVITRRNQ
jgi:hypothetical protein